MSGDLVFVVNDADFFLSHRAVLARAAAADGWRVHVAVADGGRGRLPETPAWRVHRIPMSRSGLSPIGNMRSLLALVRLCRKLRPSVVHAVAVKAVVLGGAAARLAGVRGRVLAIAGLGHVFTERGCVGGLARLASRILLPWLAGREGLVIVQNESDQAWARAARIDNTRLVLIPGSGVDLAVFAQRPEPPGPLRAVLPARMIWKKGVDEFVEAARLLRARGVPLEFALAGAPDPGNPGSVPEATLQAWNDDGLVAWLGHCEDMPAVIGDSHIVALPSFYGEGVPKALLEAAAIGRPVVTTDTPGCGSAVAHEETGLLVPTRDPKALAAALERLAQDGDLRRRLGTAGRARAERLFDVSGVVDRHLAIYRKVGACGSS